MKRSNIVLLAAGALFVLSMVNLLRSRGQQVSASGPNANSAGSTQIAAPGRVEAVSEEIRVSSELSGRLRTVRVEEGDRVQRGQVLAEIENDDYRARVAEAEAGLAQREAGLRRAGDGARTQERRGAGAPVETTEAVVKNNKGEAEQARRTSGRKVDFTDGAGPFRP